MTASANLAPGIAFEDDWYAVQQIDERTFAIGEPLYQQQNWSYLIVGETGTLLFDTGSFCRDITGVVERRLRGPLTVLPSHMHFDHLGNITKFDSVAIADLPMLRDCVQDGLLTPTEELFLGSFEGNTAPSFSVSRWIPVEEVIDLGDRCLRFCTRRGTRWTPFRSIRATRTACSRQISFIRAICTARCRARHCRSILNARDGSASLLTMIHRSSAPTAMSPKTVNTPHRC